MEVFIDWYELLPRSEQLWILLLAAVIIAGLSILIGSCIWRLE